MLDLFLACFKFSCNHHQKKKRVTSKSSSAASFPDLLPIDIDKLVFAQGMGFTALFPLSLWDF